MAQDMSSGPGGSVADIQSDAQTDNLQDADTVADMRNADPEMPDIQDEMTGDEMTDDTIEDEQQLVSDSDAIDSGSNDSDLGAEQAGLTKETKGSDAGLDNDTGSNTDRATGLGAFRD